MVKKLRILCITILLLITALSVPVLAEGTTQIIETQTTDNDIIFYVSGIGSGVSSVEYQIGTNRCDVTVEGIAENIRTIILWDNSLSVMKRNENEVRSLLRGIVSNGVSGEEFAIYTLSVHPTLLVDFTADVNTLTQAIDYTQMENKDAFVVENLHEIVKQINDTKSEDFYRIVVVSDGVDSSTFGASKTELDKILDVHKYPVYTISTPVKNEADKEDLKNMYSLSRNTGAQYFEFNGNISAITDVLYTDSFVMKFKCLIPNELRDGSRPNTRLIVDGREFEAEVQMPWADAGEAVEEIYEEEVIDAELKEDEEGEKKGKTKLRTPSLSDKDEESDGFFDKLIEKLTLTGLILIVTVLVVFISVIVIIILLSKSKKRKTLLADENRIKKYDKLDMELENGWKNRAGECTEMYGLQTGESTMMLFDGPMKIQPESGRMVTLSNIDFPGISYQAPLTGVITVGREKYNTITIENDRSVSKTHCEIFEMNGEVYIKDSGSSNGTYLGPKDLNPRLTNPERLMNNVTVSIGQYLYSVTIS